MLIVFGAAFSVAITLVTGQGKCCKDGWFENAGSCYLLTHDTSVDFTEAEDYCRLHGGYLVNVGSPEENAFLTSWLKRFNTTNIYWMGLTDEIVENVWKWRDNDQEQLYNDWAPGEPNTFQGHNEDCAVFLQYLQYKWADVDCNTRLSPICEISISE